VEVGQGDDDDGDVVGAFVEGQPEAVGLGDHPFRAFVHVGGGLEHVYDGLRGEELEHAVRRDDDVAVAASPTQEGKKGRNGRAGRGSSKCLRAQPTHTQHVPTT